MKKILFIIMCAAAVFTACIPVNAQEKRMLLQSSQTIRINEQYGKELADAKGFEIQELDDEAVISVNGASSIIGSGAVGEGYSDFVIEADIQQTACTGATSGVFSIGLRSGGTQSTQYRLVYVSALNYNESTKGFGNGQIVNDRLAIVRTSGSDACSTWYYAAVSEKPLGILKSGATPWIHLRGVITDDGIEFSAYDENGAVISSLYCTMEEVNMGIAGLPIVESGGIMLSSHSSNVYVKNMEITPIEEYSEIKIEPEYERMYKGQKAGVKILGGDGKELYSGAYNAQNVSGGVVCFDEAGLKSIEVKAKDAVTGEEYTASCDIEVVESIDFTAIEAELSDSGIVCGGSTQCRVWAIAPDGVRYNVEAQIFGEDITVEDNIITSSVTGKKTVKIKYGSLETTAALNVSSFYDIRLVPCRDSIQMWDKLHIWADADNLVFNIQAEDLIYDENAFAVENGRLKAKSAGKHSVFAYIDSVKIGTEIEVTPKKEGVVLYEDFENSQPSSQYMQYNPAQIVSDGENRAFRIENETTDFFGDEDWQDYRIDFKLKIENSVIEDNQYASVFEIIPRRKIPEGNVFGGDKGIPFVYRGGHNINSPHMRISVAPGPEINIEDGSWHEVSAEVNGCRMLFSIDGVQMCYSGSFPKKGYFSFRASNMSVYIDDVTVTRIKSEDTVQGAVIERLEAGQSSVTIPVHDAFSLSALTPVRAYYSDGTSRYLDIVNEVKWSIESGEGFHISRNRGLSANKPGAAQLRGEAGGKSFILEVTAYDDGMTDREYAEKTLRKRRETYIYSMQKSYDEGTAKGIGGLANLASYYGEMLLYPRDRDYSEILDWHALQAEYEDTIVGRGNDGGDFIILQMINIYNKLKGRINADEDSFEGMREYLCGVRYPDPSDWMSENHKGVFYATAILVGETFPDDIMMDGMTGKQLAEKYTEYMKTWTNQRFRRGFMEYDSAHYYNVDIYTFEQLYAVTKNDEMKKLARDMLTYIYADILSDSLEDVMTGAHSRIYAGMAYTTKFKMLEIMFDLSKVAFDELAPEKAVQDAHIMFGEYEPPEVIYDMAFDKEKYLVNKERRSLYAIPDDLLITDTMEKYTYTTPTYSMGCVVRVDDLEKYRSSAGNYQPVTVTYPASLRRNIIQGQQEIPWSLQFAGSSDTMIYEGHPGPYGPAAATHAHGYFAGDLHCNCYQYFQEENVSIGMHKITRAGEVKYTHFWLPKDNFEEIAEQDGWIFVRNNGTFAAIKPLKDGKTEGTLYSWGDKNQKYNNAYPLDKIEVRTDSADTAFACEVHEAAEYNGNFDDFRRSIIENTSVKYSVSSDYYIEYTATDGKVLKIDYNNNTRYLNGIQIDTHEYKMQDSKYVSAEWDKGEIEISSSENSYKISVSLSPISAETAAAVIDRLNSFQQELSVCSKSRLGALLSSNGSETADLVKSLSQYSRSKLLDMCREKAVDISDKLSRMGAYELAAEINAALAEIKTTEE